MTEPDYKDGQEDERTFEAEDSRDGVSYTTPSARPSSTPSLEVGNNETIFIRGERKHIPWSTQFLFNNNYEQDDTVVRPLNEGEG
jgi:hypothetical protein